MQCPTPLYLRDKITAKWLTVPCGKCEICLDNRRQDWFVRLQEEMRTAKLSLFITLTYDEEFIPINDKGVREVSEVDVTTFFKRLRKKIQDDEKEISFRYFLASEYGSQGQRPHYHCCLFCNFSYTDVDGYIYTRHYIEQAIRAKWGKGFVDIGLLKPGGLNYVTKYIHKKKSPPDGAKPTFQRQSKGLGESYLNFNTINYHKANVIFNNKYLDHTTTYRLPRYYREKIYNEKEKHLLKKHYEIQQEVKSDEEFKQISENINKWRITQTELLSQIEGQKRQLRKRLKMSSGVIDT